MPLEIRKKKLFISLETIRDIEHANLAKRVFKNTSNDLAKFIKSKIYGK